MYVCMYVCMHACMYADIHIYIYICFLNREYMCSSKTNRDRDPSTGQRSMRWPGTIEDRCMQIGACLHAVHAIAFSVRIVSVDGLIDCC